MIRIAGHALEPTAAADTYWRFAAARQRVYERRVAGAAPPWTADPVLARYRFTNVFRVSDRVSQELLTEASYAGSQEPHEILFRTLLFKLFNRTSTWRALVAHLGEVSWTDYSFGRYSAILSRQAAEKGPLYSAAYIMPQPALGEPRKFQNHLRLIEMIMTGVGVRQLQETTSTRRAFQILSGFPSIGPFLAYQLVTDLGYSHAFSFSESEFTMPGPGALDGIAKCYGTPAARIGADVIRWMADHQADEFARLGLDFGGLRGRRMMRLMDVQNVFCEISKYARVVHPEIPGISRRTKIKQTFSHNPAPLTAWLPPLWGLGDTIESMPGRTSRLVAGAFPVHLPASRPWVHGSKLGREHRNLGRHMIEDHNTETKFAEFAAGSELHGRHDAMHNTAWACYQDLPHGAAERHRP